MVFVDAWAGLTAGMDPIETARVGGAAYTLVVGVGTAMTGVALLAGELMDPRLAIVVLAALGGAAVIGHLVTSSPAKKGV